MLAIEAGGKRDQPDTPAPTFTVCVPAYNAERMIGATIESVLGQSERDFELIVVDDGSTDRTTRVVEGYAAADPRLRLIRQANAGAPAARNAAIAAGRGPLLAFIDNDDIWLPDYLLEARLAFERDPAVGLVHADARSFTDPGRRIQRGSTLAAFGRIVAEGDPDRVLPNLIRTNFISASSVSARRSAVLDAGCFADETFGSEDWDLWLRILAAGHSLGRAGERPLVLLRNHPGSVSKNSERVARARLLVAERALSRSPAGPQAEAARRLRAACERDLDRLLQPRAAERLVGRMRAALAPLKHRLLDRFEWVEPSGEAAAALSLAVSPGAGGDPPETG